MDYDEIKPIADKYLEKFRPYCDRIEIAGSVRRKCHNCNDIEIVYIPNKKKQWELYDIIACLPKIKGDPFGKYTQRIVDHGIKLDIFQATPENWGLIFAIRTGSADFSKALAAEWVRKGYHSKGGILITNKGVRVPVPEEEYLFDLLGIPFVDPVKR